MSKEIRMLIESATIKVLNREGELSQTASYSHNRDFPTFIGTREELYKEVLKHITLNDVDTKFKHFVEVNGFEYDGEQDEDTGTWYCNNLITHRSNLNYMFEDYYKAASHNNNPANEAKMIVESDPRIEMMSIGWLVNV